MYVTPLHRNFVSNLKHYRVLRGLTQTELGRAAQLPQARISEMERGVYSPNLATVDRIAIALQIPSTSLLMEPASIAKASKQVASA